MRVKAGPLTDRFAVAAMFAANGLTMGVWASLIPGLLPRFGISALVVGLLILGLGLGAASVMPLAGRLITLRGAGPVTFGFALPMLATLPLIALAPSLWVLTPAIVALGLTLGGMDVAMNAAAVGVERRHGRAIMSSSHGFWSLGGFVGGIMGSYLAAGQTPALAGFAAAGLAAALVVPAGMYLRAQFPAPEATREPRPEAKRLLPRDPAVWVLGFMALAAMVPEGAVLDWAAIYMRRELGTDAATSGLAFAVFSGAMAVMRFSGDVARARLGAVRALRLSGIAGALGLALAAAGLGPTATLTGFAICGLGVANMVPVLFSAAGNHPGLPSAQVISLVSLIGYSGILAAPGLIGLVADRVGLALTFGVLSLLLAVVAVLANSARAAEFHR
jgi:MFS family permease